MSLFVEQTFCKMKFGNATSLLDYDNAPINSKVQHPPRATPRATPRAYELLKISLFKFPPLGAKKPFKCPTN